jgi:hypothetical protein
MQLFLTRMFALLTLTSYLLVGAVAVRLVKMSSFEISLSPKLLQAANRTELPRPEIIELDVPEIVFYEKKLQPKKLAKTKIIPAHERVKLPTHNLPFYEPIKLHPVYQANDLPVFAHLFKEIKNQEMVATVDKNEAMISDEVNMVQSKTNFPDEELSFFEYGDEEVRQLDHSTPPAIKEQQVAQAAVEKSVENHTANENLQNEEVSVQDLVAFDYSSLKKDINTGTAPIVSKVITQKSSPLPVSSAAPVKPKEEEIINKSINKSTDYSMLMTIQASGTDLKKTYSLNSFELKFQDDFSTSVEDYGSGAVEIRENLSYELMTRSAVLLKKGFAPTNTDLIFEKGSHLMALPLIEEEVFNEMMAPFEKRGVVGAVLVELDDETEDAYLDVPYGSVTYLDGDLKKTTKKDYRYLLFMGVKSGNALLSYKDYKGIKTSKIIHVHDRELTYDANFYEVSSNETLALYEEELLGKEKSPLIIGATQLNVFATDRTANKISNNIYKIPFEKGVLGGRYYTELNHLQEPLFLGVRNTQVANIPSERFMRHILSNVEGGRLNDRCLIQINLSRKAIKVDVGAESVGQTLMTYTQILDQDGKFYDSVSEKSRKVIIVGEAQGSKEYAPEAKINVKIEYTNGSIEYLSSYCSPNTYLVEQL